MKFEYNYTTNSYWLTFNQPEIPKEFRGSIAFFPSSGTNYPDNQQKFVFIYSQAPWTASNSFSYNPSSGKIIAKHTRWRPTEQSMEFEELQPDTTPFKHHKKAILEAEITKAPPEVMGLLKKTLEIITL